MPRATHVQTSFTAGEISPRLLGRSDLTQYRNGLKTASNAIIYPHGMVSRRPGTKFVAYTKDSGAAKLIPFQYNDDQSYVVEIGDEYARFFRDGIQITEDLTSVTATFSGSTATYTKSGHRLGENDYVEITGMSDSAYNVSGYVSNVTATTWDMTITSTPGGAGSGGTATVPLDIAAPWASGDVSDLKYTQSADVLYVCHPRYLPRKISRVGADEFTIENFELRFGPMGANPQETDIYLTSTEHDARVVDGTVYKDGLNDTDYEGIRETEHFEIRILDDTLSWDHDGADGTTGTTIGRIFKFRQGSSRYFVYAQIYQTIDTKNAYAVVLQNNAVGGTSDWNFNGEKVRGRTRRGTDEWYLGQLYGAIDERTHNAKSIASALWSSGTGTLTITCEQKHCMDRATTEEVVISGFDSENDINGTYTATPTGVYDFQINTPDPGVIVADTGLASFPRFLTNTSQEGGTSINQPSVPSFFQQRLFIGRTPDAPNRIFASSTGDFENFEARDSAPPYDVLDTNALTLTIDDDHVNGIRWMRSVAKGLIVGTEGAEYVISGSSTNDVLTPSSARSLRQTDFGSDTGHVNVLSGRSILFAHRSGTRLIELAYSFQADQQVGSDASLISEHILKPGIKEMTVQEVPVSLIWIALDNGNLAAFTYDKEQEVFGWSTASMGGSGSVESIVAIPETDEDAVWMIVERGGDRFVEVMQAPVDIDTDETDLWYVDAGLKLDALNTDTNDTMTYTASDYSVNESGTLSATGHTPFSGTASDVGNRYRLFDADGNWYDFEITEEDTTTSATVKLLTDNLPTSLQATATSSWAALFSTLSGLEHLEGQTIKVFADGGVLPDKTVSSGQISLGRDVSKIIVGYGYSSVMESLPIRVLQYFTDPRGKVQSLYNVEINVWRSLGGEVDFGEDAVELQYRKPGTAFNTPIGLNSRIFDVSCQSDFSSTQTFKLTTNDPVPMNILSIVYELKINQQY